MTAKEFLRQSFHGYSDEQFEKEIQHFPLSECLCAVEHVQAENKQLQADNTTLLAELAEVKVALEVAREALGEIQSYTYPHSAIVKATRIATTALSQIDKLNKEKI